HHTASRISRSWTTQLPTASCGVTSHGLDFHLLTEQHHRRTVPDSRARTAQSAGPGTASGMTTAGTFALEARMQLLLTYAAARARGRLVAPTISRYSAGVASRRP